MSNIHLTYKREWERVRERENRPNEALDYAEEMELMGLDQESEREIGGERVSEQENIATQLNQVIYGKAEFNLDDLQDIVGDGDLAEYL